MSEDKIVRIIVTGRVQGVGFRYFVGQEAMKLGVHGWVRNRRDGSVEAVAAGSTETVGRMIEACRKGPMGSRVDTVHSESAEAAELTKIARGELFTQLPTV